MNWFNYLKSGKKIKKVSIHMSGARPCINSWAREQPVGVIIELNDILNGARECYFESLIAFIDEEYPDKPPDTKRGVVTMWKTHWNNLSPKTAAAVTQMLVNNPEPGNSWTRRKVKGGYMTYRKVG